MANSPAIRSMESLTARIPAAEIDADGMTPSASRRAVAPRSGHRQAFRRSRIW